MREALLLAAVVGFFWWFTEHLAGEPVITIKVIEEFR